MTAFRPGASPAACVNCYTFDYVMFHRAFLSCKKKAILARGFYEDKEKDSSLEEINYCREHSNT